MECSWQKAHGGQGLGGGRGSPGCLSNNRAASAEGQGEQDADGSQREENNFQAFGFYFFLKNFKLCCRMHTREC